MRVRFTPRAYGDLENIDDYFSAESPAAGRAILATIEITLRQLLLTPRLGKPTSTPSVRCLVLPRYPYKIFYRLNDDAIEVLSVFHTSQNPDKASF